MKYFFIETLSSVLTTNPRHDDNMTTNDYLAKQNPHPRDAHIHFDEGPHKYTIEGINGVTADTEFTSVTTMVHQYFEHFDAKKVIAAMMRNQKKWNDPVANAKYYGKTAEEIEQMWAAAGKDASTKGTEMHYKIECFYNTQPAVAPATNSQSSVYCSAFAERCERSVAATAVGGRNPQGPPPEIEYFLNFHQEYVAADEATLRPYRTEWTVFHEEAQIAGSIDMVYSHIDDGSLMIYDWKRCREITKTNRAGKFGTHPAIEHLPDTNFWHYALQLNTYKYILQTKYGKTITDLYLIVLHPDAQNYQRVKLPDLQTEVAELFEERIRNNNH